MKRITHVIFDLGEVIIRLNTPKMIEEFRSVSSLEFNVFDRKWNNFPHFHSFELGKIEPIDFFEELQTYLRLNENTLKLMEIWNNQLDSFIPSGLIAINEAKKLGLHTSFLSNTNHTHQQAFDAMSHQKLGFSSLSDLVDVAFYSNLVQERKPDARIFEIVLRKLNISPEHILFLDDKVENLNMASSFGIKTKQITQTTEFYLSDIA